MPDKKHIFDNPYPENIFKPLGDEDYKKIHKLLKKNGYTLDRLSGNIGRDIRKGLIYILKKEIEEWE